MSDPDSVWVGCPLCKRRIPPHEPVCRCGMPRPAPPPRGEPWWSWSYAGWILAILAGGLLALQAMTRRDAVEAPRVAGVAVPPAAPPPRRVQAEPRPPTPEPTPSPSPDVAVAEPVPEAAALPPPPSTTWLSSIDEQYQRVAFLRPRVAALAQRADQLDSDFRFYIEGCYEKFTASHWSAPRSGTRARDFTVVYGKAASVAYQDAWEGPLAYSGEMVQCRSLWTDIVRDSSAIRTGVEDVRDDARMARVIPGVTDALLEEYRLVW
jgi:hypothetical protein